MFNRLKEVYREMKRQYLGEKTAILPEKYWSQFVCVGASSDWHYFFRRVIPKEKKKVLIVGAHGGRDYFYFKTEGYDVVGTDLFPDPDYGDVIIGNIEDIDLGEKVYDVIVASAVIEHLPNDHRALVNIRRSLKDDGYVVALLPLYNDWETTHMHIYSKETIRRLFEAAGLPVKEYFGYPNIFIYPPIFNILNHALNFITYRLFKKTVYEYTLPPLWKLDFWMSRQHSLPFRIWRALIGSVYNGTLITVVAKKGEAFDHVNFNKEHFKPK